MLMPYAREEAQQVEGGWKNRRVVAEPHSAAALPRFNAPWRVSVSNTRLALGFVVAGLSLWWRRQMRTVNGGS